MKLVYVVALAVVLVLAALAIAPNVFRSSIIRRQGRVKLTDIRRDGSDPFQFSWPEADELFFVIGTESDLPQDLTGSIQVSRGGSLIYTQTISRVTIADCNWLANPYKLQGHVLTCTLKRDGTVRHSSQPTEVCAGTVSLLSVNQRTSLWLCWVIK